MPRFARGRHRPEAPVYMRPPRFLYPLHEVVDVPKRDTLAEDMKARGWQGAPLVADSVEHGTLVTGSHRISAARKAGLDEVPVVEIADVYTEGGADFSAVQDEYGNLDYDDDAPMYSRMLEETTPPEMKQKYGIDIKG